MALPSWTLSGILGLLLSLYIANNFRGQYHGAGQPQDPGTGNFISEDEDFWRWVIGGLAVTAITAYIAPKIGPSIINVVQNISLLGKIIVGIWTLIILRAAFSRFN